MYERLEPFGSRHADLAACIAGAHLLAAWTGKTVDLQAMADMLVPQEEEPDDGLSVMERMARALGAEAHGDSG